jgi:hypothetical protein
MITKFKIFESYNEDIYWHGTASQDLRGGYSGLHLGTYEAATQALEATIGIPVNGTWDGTREYGKTKLCGKKTLRIKEKEKEKYITGYNCDALENDFYPKEKPHKATYSNGKEIPLNCRPIIFPCKIVGEMTNSKYNPHSDQKANSMMVGQLKKGNAKRGYYYENDGEDSGSISVVVPNSNFIEKIDLKSKFEKFDLFENNNKLFPVEVGKYLYHGTSPYNRKNILKNGFILKTDRYNRPVGDGYEDAIFATNSDNEKNWYFTTKEHKDIWRIDTSKIKNVWYRDQNMLRANHFHVVTYEPIPPEALELLHKSKMVKENIKTSIEDYRVPKNYEPIKGGFYLRFTDNPDIDLIHKYSRWYDNDLSFTDADEQGYKTDDFGYYKNHTGLSGHFLDVDTLKEAISEVEKKEWWFRNSKEDNWAIFESDDSDFTVKQDTPEGNTFSPYKVLYFRNYNLKESVTPKTNIEDEIDRLMDKGYDNLTPGEKQFLKNPYEITIPNNIKQQKEKQILKYYDIAQDFFDKIVGTDIRNYELNDSIDLFDIMADEDEVYQVANTLYYVYGVEIDPENNNDYKLVNIFKKISNKE